MDIKRKLAQNYVNFRGWSSKKKYVIFESDDWGSIRMPSRKVYDKLINNGVAADKNYFTKYDCLESNDDIELLFELLSFFKDYKNNPVCITAVSLLANPDFEKIEASRKTKYYYETIEETYKKYPNHDRVLKLWKSDGIQSNLLYPQFHGREHLNVKKWMYAINANIDKEQLAFENKVILGIGNIGLKRTKLNYTAAFEYEDEEHKLEIEEITKDGLNLFKDIFGFRSTSFAASSSIRGEHLDKVLTDNGVIYHQLGQQFIPQENGNLKIKNRFWGDQNNYGQIYWRRNATFEPSKNPHEDWVDKCLKDIEIAFRWGKPAVINSHRVNFSSGISTKNRDHSLKEFKRLLKKIIAKWSEVEFINSEQLGDIIANSKK